MWLFLVVFFIVALNYTVFNLSLSISKKVLWGGIAFVVIYCFSIYPLCLRINNQTLAYVLEQSNVVSFIALVQTFESLALIFLSILHTRGYYTRQTNLAINWITAIPSLVFLLGLFFLQTYVFVYTENTSFIVLALLFSLSVGLLIFCSTWTVKKLFPEWDLRAELKMLIAMLQILLAMFLPLIVKGIKVPFSNLNIETQSIMITTVVVGGLALVGFIKFQIKNRIKNRQ